MKPIFLVIALWIAPWKSLVSVEKCKLLDPSSSFPRDLPQSKMFTMRQYLCVYCSIVYSP